MAASLASPRGHRRQRQRQREGGGDVDRRQAGSERPLLSNPGSSSPAGGELRLFPSAEAPRKPLRGRAAAREPRSRRPSVPQRIPRRPEEPRAAARKPRPLAEVPLGHVIAFPALSWRRGERAVPTGPRAEVAPREGRARSARREQDGGQGEEEEGKHLGPLQVHRQDHPSEIPGRPGSQRRPERLRPAAQPGAGWHRRVHERSR